MENSAGWHGRAPNLIRADGAKGLKQLNLDFRIDYLRKLLKKAGQTTRPMSRPS